MCKLMTEYEFYKTSCTRCGHIGYCIIFEGMAYCEPCFDTITHDPTTKDDIAKIMIRCGIEQIEN